jgi:MoxR-like ATPase
MDGQSGRSLLERIAANIEQVMRGQHDAVRKLLAAFASGGHVLIDDYPGTGKTTLAKSLARRSARASHACSSRPTCCRPTSSASRSSTRRSSCSSSARAGVHVDPARRRNQPGFAAHAVGAARSDGRGPGVRRRAHAPHGRLFFVVATQNPVEFRGTYPLPEAQMDRFAMCLALGYCRRGTEAQVLAHRNGPSRSPS